MTIYHIYIKPAKLTIIPYYHLIFIPIWNLPIVLRCHFTIICLNKSFCMIYMLHLVIMPLKPYKLQTPLSPFCVSFFNVKNVPRHLQLCVLFTVIPTDDFSCSPDMLHFLCIALSQVQLFATPWFKSTRLLCPEGFSQQEYWSGLRCPAQVAQSCPTLCDPMDYTIHEIL